MKIYRKNSDDIRIFIVLVASIIIPAEAELDEIHPWLEEQEANPDWSAYTRPILDDLRKRLACGV